MFDKHVLKLDKWANQNLSALSRNPKLFSFNEGRALFSCRVLLQILHDCLDVS